MIEIPESLNMAAQLNATVKGKRIAQVETEHTEHKFAFYGDNPQDYCKLMAGLVFGEARGIGSMVEISLGAYHFMINDGVNLRYYGSLTDIPARYQTRITFEDGSSLICSVQMYGAMVLFDPAHYDNIYYEVAVQKPMPLTEGFDEAYFASLRDNVKPTLSIKAFLATEQRIPGLGNGVLQDILFEAGLHPKRKINTLTEADWQCVYRAVVDVLAAMTKTGGRDTEKDLFGKPGNYATRLSKKTLGSPCPRCGQAIQKASYLGGTVYFCPGCQEV